ncbi:hypothetical protein AQUCO_01400633v1 [Aquilegia coerulea]|uniref:Pentacotripeptide-repeat region of PRORP domain-containing protein n=1 Tax=Aquilegia coerulea TaxID=218851 RepID=A0A2G5DXG0_AQUCA|nr:hypothetical protein AQUCO_01400633v1 [Aquilegia coerulea]
MKKMISLVAHDKRMPRAVLHSVWVDREIITRSNCTVSHFDPLERLDHQDWLSPNEVVEIFERLRNPESVMNVLEKFSRRKDYKPNEALYSVIIRKLSQAKKFNAIQDILKRVKAEKTCRLSDDFFYGVIKTYGNAGYIDRAIETLFSMPEYNCWPAIKTFNYVLNLLVSSKQFDILPEVYLGASRLGLEIDTCCLNILIKGLCKSGKLDAAFALLDEFPKLHCEPNVQTYSTLMNCLCKGGRVDEALKLCESMEQAGVDPDTITFNTLISGLCKQGRVADGMELLEKMRFKGCNPDAGTYQALLYGLLDSKKFVEAKCLMDKMISLGVFPSYVSYKLVIHGLSEEHLLEDVDLVLKKMLRQGFVPRMGMWKTILKSIFSGKINDDDVSQFQFSELTKNL